MQWSAAAPSCSSVPANTGFLKEDVCQVKVRSQGSCLDSEPEVVLNNTAENVSNRKHFELCKAPHLLNKIQIQLFYLLFKVLNTSRLAKQQKQQNSCSTRQQLSLRSNCNMCFYSQAWNPEWLHNLEFRASEDTCKHIYYLLF